MLSIKLNDKEMAIDANCSLAELLQKKKLTETHFAIAINQNFVARARYEHTFLKEGDVIELVAPMQGG